MFKKKESIFEKNQSLICVPASNKDYQLMRLILDDAEVYLNRGSKDVENALLKKLIDKINEYNKPTKPKNITE